MATVFNLSSDRKSEIVLESDPQNQVPENESEGKQEGEIYQFEMLSFMKASLENVLELIEKPDKTPTNEADGY